MTSELRNLVWLVIGAAVVMASIAAATGIYVFRGEPESGTIRVTSGSPLYDPAGTNWRDPAPASGETRAGDRVTIRPLDESGAEPESDWSFSYEREEERGPLSFETLFGGRAYETGNDAYRPYDRDSGWRRGTGYSRYASPERWRPTRDGTDPEERDSPWGRDRPEPSGQERVAAAGIDTSTPDGRLERDCLLDNRSRYACRCLVREVRRGLTPAELDFLTRADEGEPPATRLRAAGLDLTTLPALAVKLVALDAQTRRACRVGLTL